MDWDQVNTLLSVIHQAAAAGPKFAPFAKAAEADLFDLLNAEAAPEVEEDPVPAPTNGRRV